MYLCSRLIISAIEQFTQERLSAIFELLPESSAAVAHLCVLYVGVISHRELANYAPEPDSVALMIFMF